MTNILTGLVLTALFLAGYVFGQQSERAYVVDVQKAADAANTALRAANESVRHECKGPMPWEGRP